MLRRLLFVLAVAVCASVTLVSTPIAILWYVLVGENMLYPAVIMMVAACHKIRSKT